MDLTEYIKNDSDLKQQAISIDKAIQDDLENYDHAQAPTRWLDLVDNAAEKYVEEEGGDIEIDWPADSRLSIANDYANECKKEMDCRINQPNCSWEGDWR